MDAVVYNKLNAIDSSLIEYFSWAGGYFPFNQGASDITISGATTWNDAIGYKKVKKLTINAGQTLTITKSPFYIFADEIAFGDTNSTIDASGRNGASGTPHPLGEKAVGATTTNASCIAQGGCGGGMLFIIAKTITGAAGKIKADGGAGWANGVSSASYTYRGGQGALSTETTGALTVAAEQFDGVLDGVSVRIPVTAPQGINLNYRRNLLNIMGNAVGGGGANIAKGGGSGNTFTSGNQPCGGSGIGGGGSCYTYPGSNGLQPAIIPSIQDLIMLARMGCLGGGAGAATCGPTNYFGGAAGGGGSVVVWAHSIAANPTISANGGVRGASGNGGQGDGAAGVTYQTII